MDKLVIRVLQRVERDEQGYGLLVVAILVAAASAIPLIEKLIP